MTDITQIIREHQDRWTKLNNTYYAVVDKYSEGINGVSKDCLTGDELYQYAKMYVVQISKNATTPDTVDTHPYDVYVCYDTSIHFSDAGTTILADYQIPAAANPTKTYLVTEGTVRYASTNTITCGVSTATFENISGICRAIKIQLYSNRIYIKGLYYTTDRYPYAFLGSKDLVEGGLDSGQDIRTSNTKYLYTHAIVANDNYYLDTVKDLDILINSYTKTEINTGLYAARDSVTLNNLDKTNSSIMGIYCVPYVKFNTSNATFVEGYNLIKPNTLEIYYQIGSSIEVPGFKKTALPTVNTSWSSTFETKLLSNEISDIGVYWQGECLFAPASDRYTSGGLYTISISERISEKNPQYLSFFSNSNYYDWLNKYERYHFTAAKYTVPLYTNDWTEYVRNGYNYDVAERERQKTLQGWNIALNTAAAAASFIPGVGQLASAGISGVGAAIKTAHNLKMAKKVAGDITVQELAESTPEEKADVQEVLDASALQKGYVAFKNNYQGTKGLGQMVLNQGIGAVNSAVSAAYSIQSANANYQQNINTKMKSHTAIAGNNVDYSAAQDFNVELQVWQPQDYVLNNIAKTFHLTGYSHPVQEVPNTKSRYWFNYLQCIPS